MIHSDHQAGWLERLLLCLCLATWAPACTSSGTDPAQALDAGGGSSATSDAGSEAVDSGERGAQPLAEAGGSADGSGSHEAGGSGESSTADGDGGTTDTMTISVDAGEQSTGCQPLDEVVSFERCLADEDCACGSGCELGRCTSNCSNDDDCADGLACEFGMCGAQSGNIDDDPRSGGLTIEQSLATFVATDHIASLSVLTRGATDQIRAVAPEGVLVRCAAEGDFHEICETSVDSEGRVRLDLQLAADATPANAEMGSLRVYGGGHLASTSVQFAPPRVQHPTLRSGHYRGRLSPFGGPNGRAESNGVDINAEVTELSDGERLLRLVDPAELVFVGSLDVELNRSADEWTAEVGDASRLIAQAASEWSADVAFDFELASVQLGASFVRLELAARPLGMLPTEELFETEETRYLLTLSRFAPLNESDLSAPDERVLTENPAARAARSSTWEDLQRTAASCPDDLPAARCAQRLLCAEGVNAAADILDTAPEFDASLEDSPRADLLCAGDLPQRAFAAFSSALPGPALLQACLEDLQAFNAGPETDTAEELLADSPCMGAPRVIAALSVAMSAQDEAEAAAIAQHLLKQWFEVLAFVSNERVQANRMEAILESAAPQLDSNLSETLEIVGTSFDVLMHPRVAQHVLQWSPAVLERADYRSAFVTDPPQNALQSRPLFEAMLGAISAYVDAGNRLLSESCGSGLFDSATDALATEISRRAHALLDVSHALQLRAPPTGAGGQTASEGAQTRINVGLARLAELLYTCRTQGNPLGIDDVDLPLYFGDATSANSRFGAISDYLIGATPGARGAWVPAAIEQSEDALDAARTAWLGAAERDLRQEYSDAEASRRSEAISRRYGEQILTLCGPQPGLSSDTVLEAELDPERCYLAEMCTPDEDAMLERLSTADMAYSLCVTGKLREHAGPVTGYGDSDLDDLADEFARISTRTESNPDVWGDVQTFVTDYLEGATPVAGMFTGAGVLGNDVVNQLLARNYPESALSEFQRVEPADAEALLEECNALRASIDSSRRPELLPESCVDSSGCPVGFFCLESECQPEASDPLADLECYKGAIGERVLSLRGMATEIDIAKSEFAELTERYDIAMRSCMIQQLAGEAMETEIAAHSERMSQLQGAKRDVDKINNALQTVATVAAAAAVGGPVGLITGAAALGSGIANDRSAALEGQIGQAEADHQLALDRIEREADNAQCFNDATQHLVGARSATLRITRVAQEAAAAMLALRNMKQQVRALLRDGRAELANETGRRILPLAQNLWVDENIDIFERKFRIAQRAAFMAVRAVEYEFQACLDQREAVVAARTPADLDSVVDILLSSSSTRSIGGRRPNDGVVVLSLKDDILSLADRSDFAPGYYAFTPERRLQLLLSSPSNAAVDEQGQYIGQRINFSLSPRALEASARALVSGNACAERLWSVNASVLGEGALPSDGTSFVEVELEKQNSFYSSLCPQACAEAGQNDLQLASVRPSRNLFVDPLAGSAQGVGPQSSAEPAAYSSARLRAYAGVSRRELESDQYDEGDSEELAGRGLWGDYALLIPAAVIQQDGRAGLTLRNVDDILLRLEYVSVAAR